MQGGSRWADVERLYHEALALDAAGREALLAGQMEGVRRELKSLLEHDTDGDDFLDQPAVEAAVRQTIAAAYLDLGLPKEAEGQARRAVGLREGSEELRLEEGRVPLMTRPELRGEVERVRMGLAVGRK